MEPNAYGARDTERGRELAKVRATVGRAGSRLKRSYLRALAQAFHDKSQFEDRGAEYVRQEATPDYEPDGAVQTLKYAGQMGGDLVGVVLSITIAAVIGYVGLSVLSSTENSTDFEQDSNFDNASNELSGGIESAFSLMDVVFIALMLGIIVSALLFLRQR
jgi:hypothetical protein